MHFLQVEAYHKAGKNAIISDLGHAQILKGIPATTAKRNFLKVRPSNY